ncbi:MAG: cytochrome c [Silicimonas sp.]|nr:cytochrome c [Silicimonas sp.]NNL73932.1 cytochrome c [Silicimonas sp.]
MKPAYAIAIAAGLFASAGWTADPQNGQALAVDNCARCHDIAPGGAAKLHPPSFAAIAGYRPEEQILARIMFPALHSPMPAWSQWFDRDEVDDLVAYIQSLE